MRVSERLFERRPRRSLGRASMQATAFIRSTIEAGAPEAARAAASRPIGVAGTYLTLAAHKLELRE